MAEKGRTYLKDKIDTLLGGKSDTSHGHNANSLTDVDTATVPPTVGKVLKWDGSNWVPADDEGGVGASAGVGSIDGVSPNLAGGNVDLVAGSSRFEITPNNGADTVTLDVPASSETLAGAVELASASETATGTDTARAVHPAGLAALTSTDTRAGLVELATSAETITGTDTARAVHPAGLASLTADESRAGLVEQATEAEIQAGTAGNLVATVARLKDELDRRLASTVVLGEFARITSEQNHDGISDWTGIEWNSDVVDPGGWHDPVTTPRVFTLPAGTYTITAFWQYPNNSTGNRGARLLVGGAAYGSDRRQTTAASSANERNMTWTLRLTGSTEVQVQSQQNVSGTHPIQVGAKCVIAKIA